MPLTPLPANNTDRAWLEYTSLGFEHDLCFRVPSATTQAVVIAHATALANALKPLMKTTDSFTGLKHQDSGSIVTFPLAWTAIAGTNGTATEASDMAKFMSVTGRSLAGYRCKLTFFYPYWGETLAFRQARGTGTHQDTLLDALDALTPKLVAVDGGEVIWNQYGNFGFNAYWQREART